MLGAWGRRYLKSFLFEDDNNTFIVKTVTADLVTQGARVVEGEVLTWCFWNMPASAPEPWFNIDMSSS